MPDLPDTMLRTTKLRVNVFFQTMFLRSDYTGGNNFYIRTLNVAPMKIVGFIMATLIARVAVWPGTVYKVFAAALFSAIQFVEFR